MRYEEEPLGCFQTLSYGLLGLGLYASCSLSCLVLTGLTRPSGVAFSFLCAGPAIVAMYVLYLQDITVIEVRDPAPSINQQAAKRKKAR